MSRLNINNLTNENEDGSPRISGISTFSSAHYFVPPSGTTAERPSDPGEGMIRFNTDSGHLEYYTGEFWDEVLVANNTLDGGNRGVFIRGDLVAPTVNVDTIDYITISTLGNAIDFGNDITTDRQGGACSSETRALAAGRSNISSSISYITFSSTGDAQTFGNLVSSTGGGPRGVSNSTRGMFCGGNVSPGSTASNKIDYVTIASLGDAQDFGDLTITRADGAFSCSSSTRGIVGGGSNPTKHSSIDYFTISTTGDAQDFGDLSGGGRDASNGCSNSTRGLVAGGRITPSFTNSIEFITISSTGNAQDFGDLVVEKSGLSACASSTRGIFAGGYSPISLSSPFTDGSINYITIASTGNAQYFGDLTNNREQAAGCSNGHGGL